MDWKQSIVKIYQSRSAVNAVRPIFRERASNGSISDVEQLFELKLPNSLCSLLGQSNGFSEEMELSPGDWLETNIVVYSVDQLQEVNQFYREQPYYRARNIAQYLIIATAGINGIQFCIEVSKVECEDAAVFAWYPDETPEKRMGDDLFQFLNDWCSSSSCI